MNKEWSELNKKIQQELNKAAFENAKKDLINLRNILMAEIYSWKKDISKEDFSKIPFINSDGYHSKTVAYSIWHIFRIEDIVLNTLILDEEEVLFYGNYQKKISSPIITTGNELVKNQIADFSAQLNLENLYEYISDVKSKTDRWLKNLEFGDIKRKFSDKDKKRISDLKVVSADENAIWLLDYWCGKDIKGLIQMPFSRHWIMHIEAANRIIAKISK